MRFNIIKIVFRKELRELLRDRRSLLVMFGFPLVLYPLLTLAITNISVTRQAILGEERVKIIVTDGGAAPHLMALIRADAKSFDVVEAADPRAAMAADEASAVLILPEEFEKRALAAESPKATLEIDESRSSAPFVQRKVETLLEDYNGWVVHQRLQERLKPEYAGKISEALQPIAWKTVDVATPEQRLGKTLAIILPVLLLLTGMLGALFPALNATTSERELGTLETLLVTPAGRMEILCAKGLLVLMTGLLTAALNMASMSLVLWRALSLIAGRGATLTISPGAMALAYLAAVPSILFFTTIVLIVGLLARNFREANAFATPVMLIPLGSIAVSLLEPKTSAALLMTPVASTAIIIREVLTDHASWQSFVLAFVSSTVYTVMLLGVAARLFSNEQLVNPSWEPVSIRFGRRQGRVARRRLPGIDEAMALVAVTLLLALYIEPTLLGIQWIPEGLRLLCATVATYLGLMVLPTVGLAWAGSYPWREVFSWRRAGAGEMCGAALLGAGIMPVATALGIMQSWIWPGDGASAREQAEVFAPALYHLPVVIPLVIPLLAGFVEELIYRGPVQAAFLRRLPAWAGIAAAAALFSLAHMDLHGAAIRFGLGALLGWMVYRRKSIFPAMAAHFAYDAVALGVTAWAVRSDGVKAFISHAADPHEALSSFWLTALDIGLVAAAAGAVLFVRGARRADVEREKAA